MNDDPIVWIVDDDVDDQWFIEHGFKEVIPSIRIKQLYDGEELLPCLEETPVLPKLVLLDLNMHRKGGFEALQELRDVPAYQNLPVVVLTTSTALEDRQRAFLLGANGFLTKPSSQKDIVVLLKQLASEWQLQ